MVEVKDVLYKNVHQVPQVKPINVKDMAAATDVLNQIVKQVPKAKLTSV
jgi:hypothetical protein